MIFLVNYSYLRLIYLSSLISFALSLQPYLDTDIDFAASPVDFQNLIVMESKFVLKLIDFLDQMKSNSLRNLRQVKLVEKYLKDFESNLLKDVQMNLNHFSRMGKRGILSFQGLGEDAAHNPFKIYRTIRRLVIELRRMERESGNTTLSELIKEHIIFQSYPKEIDLKTAALNILRLNQLFGLPFNEFLDGKVGPIQTHCSLSLEHLIEIGKVASEFELLSQAVDIYSTVLDHLGPNKTLFQEVGDLLDEAIKQHDTRILKGLSDEDIQYDSGPQFFNNLLYNRTLQSFKNRVLVDEKTLLQGLEMENFRAQLLPIAFMFSKLCRSEESIKNPSKDSKLKCYLTSKSHPTYILRPLKVEVHNLDPLLVQYYDVVNDQEMEEMKEEVRGEMRMSRIIRSIETFSGQTSRHRTSSNAWIVDYNHPKFHPLLDRIGRMLNLNASGLYSTENMQLAAYSPGGHYVPHTDPLFEEELIEKLDPSEFLRGDRIMTFMIYLSEIENGGATAFPIIGKVIKPLKGSAVAWFNLNSDGSIRRDTFHGGCSVVHGVKWIANKWIRSLDQMFKLKCSSSKDSLTLDI